MFLIKLIYNFAVVVFIGNMIAGLFWKMRADETKNNTIIAHTFAGIIKSDLFISIPALVIILLLDYYVNAGKLLPYTSFKLPGSILVVAMYSILVFVFIIHPIRSSLIKLVSVETSVGQPGEKYRKISIRWVVFGIMELGPLILVLVLSL